MSRATPDDQLKFLLNCVKHSQNGKIDFVEVARECAIVSKGAAAKRYERLMKANGIHPNGGPDPASSTSTMMGSPLPATGKPSSKAAIAKAAAKKKRKIEGNGMGGVGMGRSNSVGTGMGSRGTVKVKDDEEGEGEGEGKRKILKMERSDESRTETMDGRIEDIGRAATRLKVKAEPELSADNNNVGGIALSALPFPPSTSTSPSILSNYALSSSNHNHNPPSAAAPMMEYSSPAQQQPQPRTHLGPTQQQYSGANPSTPVPTSIFDEFCIPEMFAPEQVADPFLALGGDVDVKIEEVPRYMPPLGPPQGRPQPPQGMVGMERLTGVGTGIRTAMGLQNQKQIPEGGLGATVRERVSRIGSSSNGTGMGPNESIVIVD